MANGGKNPCGHGLVMPDMKSRRRGVGQKFELLDSLPQLIEHSRSTTDERTAIRRGLHAVAGAIKKAQPKGVLHVRNSPGHRRLGDCERALGFLHTAVLHHTPKDVRVPLLVTPSTTLIPMPY